MSKSFFVVRIKKVEKPLDKKLLDQEAFEET